MYLLIGGEFYRRGFASPLMKFLSQDKAKYVLRERHEGIYGRHTSWRALRTRVLRTGYFQSMLDKDCGMFVQKCLSCQRHKNVLNVSATELNNLVSSWAFTQWGMNIVGPFPIIRLRRSSFQWQLITSPSGQRFNPLPPSPSRRFRSLFGNSFIVLVCHK